MKSVKNRLIAYGTIFQQNKNLILDHLIEILLLVLIIGVSIAAPSSEIGKYLKYIAECGYEGVIAYGMCLVIISGEIDLSVAPR